MRSRVGRLGVIALAIMLSAAAPLAAALQPQDGERVAAVFGPSVDRDEAFARIWRAGGVVIATGGIGNIVVAENPDPEFVSALHREGALLVIDGRLASVLCRSEV